QEHARRWLPSSAPGSMLSTEPRVSSLDLPLVAVPETCGPTPPSTSSARPRAFDVESGGAGAVANRRNVSLGGPPNPSPNRAWLRLRGTRGTQTEFVAKLEEAQHVGAAEHAQDPAVVDHRHPVEAVLRQQLQCVA